MTFKKYPKIHRIGKEEVEGILDGVCYVPEKIDGANTSIWMDEDKKIRCGSRNRELTEGFNGFVDYVKNHKGINKLLNDNPTYRLYGEWLVKHTVSYNETAYKQFYLFDITEKKDGEENEEFFDIEEVYRLAEKYDIKTPHLFGKYVNPTIEKLKELCGKSMLGEVGEGIVIKNLNFKNKFGNAHYGKIVTESFKENNAITFGGNNKHAESYWEIYVMNKYITLGRVKKIMDKIQPEIERPLDMQDIPRITTVVYNDMLTEEIWEIQKKVIKLNFRDLKKLCLKKAKQVYVDILNNDISVSDDDN